MMPIRQRYYDDPALRTMVDAMVSMIEQCQFTPTEMREAAMLAAIIYEERHIRPRVILTDSRLAEIDMLRRLP